MQARITQLTVFPVKSLAGISLDSAILTYNGLQWDRHWMIINEAGRFISQRQYPKMVLIKTKITDTQLILCADAMDDLVIPLTFSGKAKQVIKATVWKDQCSVVDEGQQASGWLNRVLKCKTPVRLVRMAENKKRPQSKPELLGADTYTLFADAAPYLICNQLSLHTLNQQLRKHHQAPVSMLRFRPNIVIDGPAAFAEHQLHTLRHSRYQLQHCYPCQRCIIPTIDTHSGIAHPQQQPFKLLATLNTMPDNPKAPAFGENAILLDGNQQTIAIGDKLILTELAGPACS
ncbi:MAG: MOSC N-terminal beta barrel domain-containing protein [Cellvibrionaceae bacterium]|nr:MOSC N-terminal beta barrel domain-containing protein [Cellvibrionaceae bacterium]